jgi:hypothetical protein
MSMTAERGKAVIPSVREGPGLGRAVPKRAGLVRIRPPNPGPSHTLGMTAFSGSPLANPRSPDGLLT